MKKIFLILFFITSPVICQSGRIGVKGLLGINTSAYSYGGGINLSFPINDISTIRLLAEYSFNDFGYGLENRAPLYTIQEYTLYQFRFQYLYHFIESSFYTGAGISYITYIIGLSNNVDYQGYHYIIQELNDTWGIDLLIGAELSQHFNIELNYVFSYPELYSEYRMFEGRLETKTERVNMGMLYLNLIYILN